MYELPNYISKRQIRDDLKGGGVSFYIHNSLSFRVLPNLCINSTDIESLSIEISLNDQRNTLVNVLYRPPSGKIQPFENFLSKLLSSVQNSNKNPHIGFLNIIYRNSMIPTINKPTRVTRKTATATDHILTKCFIDRTFKTAIFKSDISDHFPICFIIPSMKTKIKNETSFLYKRNFNTDAKHAFQNELYETNWKTLRPLLIQIKHTKHF